MAMTYDENSTNGTCPLCDDYANLKPLETRDATRIRCYTCGRFDLDGMLILQIQADETGIEKHVISGVCRQMFERHLPVILNTVLDIEQLIATSRVPGNVLEKLDLLVTVIANEQHRIDTGVTLEPSMSYPLAFCHDGDEFRRMLEILNEQGLTEDSNSFGDTETRLTTSGWQRANELESSAPISDQAFIAMWFDDSMIDARDKGFIEALKVTGFSPMVLSLDQDNEMIDDRILAELPRSGLVIADVTGQRNGVYFEAGLARGLGIPLIWTCRADEIDKVHFDTRQFNHVVWDDPDDLRQKLELRIRASIPGRNN